MKYGLNSDWLNLTWLDILKDNSIQYIQHPLYEIYILKSIYYEEFSVLLDLLNGETMTDYISFFFERSAINTSNLQFVDEDAKKDFYEWAVELKCIRSINESESKEDKNKRKLMDMDIDNITVCFSELSEKEKEKEKEKEFDKNKLIEIYKSIGKTPLNKFGLKQRIDDFKNNYLNYKNLYNDKIVFL